ncbi:MAG: universal stress protein [Noviherbaspirillum sp.]
MSYKTILVHVDHSSHAPQRIRIAAEIALRDNAHLTGVAMTGVSRFLFDGDAVEQRQSVLLSHVTHLKQQAEQSLEQFEEIVRNMGVLSWERRLVDDEPAGGVSLEARYADLVVVSQTDTDEVLPAMVSDFPEYVVMYSGRPVLIVPYAGNFSHIGSRVLLAWDGSMEASRAIDGALPFLRQAREVKVVVFNADKQVNVHGQQPGADIALYLARHGVTVDVLQESTEQKTGDALLSLAADTAADLLVMGCYAHSRFREVLLGGASRTVLESMTLPVLMSH